MENRQMCTIIWFEFKLGREATENARDIYEQFSPGPVLDVRHNGGSRNSAAETKNLKTKNVVVSLLLAVDTNWDVWETQIYAKLLERLLQNWI